MVEFKESICWQHVIVMSSTNWLRKTRNVVYLTTFGIHVRGSYNSIGVFPSMSRTKLQDTIIHSCATLNA